MNNNRFEEIQKFLQYLKEIFIYNPNLEISSNLIYNLLMNYGMSNEEIQNSNIKMFFSKWIDNFKSTPNINVFHSESQKKFLQFHNFSKNVNDVDFIKIYIPFKQNQMFDKVEELFNFMAENNISHFSKVSDTLRSDSVVLRVEHPDDANKILEYVNTKMVSSIKAVNPFLIKVGNAGIAMDNMLSYNSTVAFILSEYFNIKKNNNSLQKINLEDLQKYVNNLYTETFVNGQDLNLFLNKEEVGTTLDRRYYGNKTRGIVNYYQIVKLFNISLNSKQPLNDYSQHFVECNDQEYIKKLCNQFEFQTNQIGSQKQLLDDYIKYATIKYGQSSVFTYLNSYVNGNLKSITRDNDFRNKFENSMNMEIINKITNYDLSSYIESIQKNEYRNNYQKKTQNKMKLLENISTCTYEKYGYNQLSSALRQAVNGNYQLFTNTNNNRNLLISSVSSDEIMNLCSLKLIENDVAVDYNEILNYYCQFIVDKTKTEQIRERQL
ncbi:MAG: hypothetical protein ACK5HP_02535 [Bacilli bacterium]